MKIKDDPNFAKKSKPFTFYPEDTVRSALDIMCEKNIGSIIVVNKDETIAGIVTERDMTRRVLSGNLSPDKTKLNDIMSRNIRSAKIDDELIDWLKVMSNERFRHLPVVNDNGKLINVLSQGDFVAYTYPDLYEKIKQDLGGGIAKTLQILLIVFALITLALIAYDKF